MSRRRDIRETQALKCLVERREVSAFDLGAAAMTGEGRQPRYHDREWLGLKLGMHFVRRGFARMDSRNKFHWVPPIK